MVSLLEPPEYEAVSYTWGEPIFSASIECFSKGQLPITENLSNALFHLRLANRLRVLWVDAICINQQDLVERSQQVTLLRNTFQKAKSVIVWLGEDTGEAKKAFKIFRAIDPSASSNLEIRKLIMSDRNKALGKFLGRSWFRRIWVIQELVCAEKATIRCGNHAMEWERFLDAAIRIAKSLTFEDRSVNYALFTLVSLHSERRRRNKEPLEGVLYNYRHCLASDPRDKVFALVGIASGQYAAAYTPDYSKDVVDVYRDLAIQLITASQNPDILVHCAYTVGSKLSVLPSWVPDWSQPLYINCSPIVSPGAYEASAGTSFKGRVSEDLGELLLDGVLLNKVEVLGSAWNSDVLRFDEVKAVKRIVELNEEYLDIFRQSSRYGGSYWSACTRALVGDKDYLRNRLGCKDLSEAYVAYRKCLSQTLMAQVTRLLDAILQGGFKSTTAYQEAVEFETALNYAACGRALCLFDDGRAGWVPKTAEVGDQIAIFLGATVPILLRPRDNGYIVLGEAYVHEMMDGQALEVPDVHIETITLI